MHTQPKTAKRRSNFRRANRAMPHRRIDISTDAIDFKNPELLKKFVTETGKILSRQIIKAVSGSNVVLFPVSNLASGAYFLKMGSEETTNALRFIVK